VGRPVAAGSGYYGVAEVIIPFRKPVHGQNSTPCIDASRLGSRMRSGR
jgi:hypothetical protein